MNTEQSFLDIKKNAREIQIYCNQKSLKSCENGKCKFSTKDNRCIFDTIGMNKPHEWDLSRRRKSE